MTFSNAVSVGDVSNKVISTPIVEVKALTKNYGTAPAINGVTYSFLRGRVSVICGPSGCGKSTLLRCIHALEDFEDGDIVVDGRSLRDPAVNLPNLRADIGAVFQQPNLYPHLTCLENVTLAPRKVQRRPRKEVESEARALLARVGVAKLVTRYPSEISGGEQQRVAIARALAMRPKLMLFDEPTSALDPERVSEVLDVMADLVTDQITMIIVTHEMRFAARVANEIIFMDEGKIVEVGGNDFCQNAKTERGRKFVHKILH